MPILDAPSDDQILSCFPVLRQLRPQLPQADFLNRVRRQMATGYRLACVEERGRPVAVAGYRILENLAWGRFLYVDDLVTDAAHRSQGYGEQLFAWLVEEAKSQGCEELHLDSGVERFAAHRFYLRQRMEITSHHFALRLD